MKLILSRKYGPLSTTGKLIILSGDELKFAGVAIELPNLNNQRQFSCIPEGTYQCEKYMSERHGKSFIVKDVPNRIGIMIHVGNYVVGQKVDSEGCILPGMYFNDINDDGSIDVAESRLAITKLWDILTDDFELIIFS